MKKTLTINISGIIFHIDEDAFNKLNTYLDKLKKRFHNTEGKDEIITDIEGRIAELLQERITDSKQVITIDDISEVIALMGEPGDFDGDDDGDYEEAIPDGIRGPKRLYRDPDNKVVGGVAGGLGAYFNIDALWFRLAFIAFTMVGGSGGLIYIILWIAMPEAKTTAEKLQMRGEKVNISNIEKSIKEEVSNLTDKINDLTKKAKKTVEKKNINEQNIFEQILGALFSIVKVFFKILLIIIGIVFLLTGVGLIVAFLIAIFGIGGPLMFDNGDAIMMPLTDFFGLLPLSHGGMAILKAGLVLFLGVPLVMLMYNGFRMIFGIDRVRYIGITALNLWIVGLIICLFFSFRIGREFRHQATVTKAIEITQPISDTLFISINKDYEDELLYNSYDYINADEIHLVATEEGVFYEQIELDVKKSETGEYELSRFTHARGRSVRDAKEYAETTDWFYSQDGNTLILDPFFNMGEQDKWHGQHIWLEVNIPVGKYIYFDKNTRDILHWGRYNPRKLAGNTWIMTERGLQDPDEKGFVSPTSHTKTTETSNESESVIRPIVMQIVGLVW